MSATAEEIAAFEAALAEHCANDTEVVGSAAPDLNDPAYHRQLVDAGLHYPCPVCAPPPTVPDDEWELGPVALLEAVAEWDVEGAMNMRPDPGSWAKLAYLVRRAKQALTLAESLIARELSEIVPWGQTQEWDGAPAFMIRGGATRSAWEGDELRRIVTARIADELGVTTRAVEEVITRWCDVATPSWKVGKEPKGDEPGTGLRGLGLDPDEFCQKRPGAASIQFLD